MRKQVRQIHAVIGLISSLNLLMILTTGVLIQHRETFRLEDRTVNRAFLPEKYRVDDGPEGVRADIVITDLHSGRILGSTGTLILDLTTLCWFVLLVSGLFMFGLARFKKPGDPNSES